MRRLSIHSFYILLVLSFTQLSAAEETKEELLKKLKATTADTVRASALIDLSNYYMGSNIDSAKLLNRQALELSMRINFTKGICYAYMQLGIIYQNTGKYNEANGYFFKALKFVDKINNNKLRLQLNNSIANAFSHQKIFDQALIYYHKALQLCDTVGLSSKKAVILMNMGNVAYNKGYATEQFAEALDYFKRALPIAEENKDTNMLISIYGNYALVFTDDHQTEKALQMIEKAKDLSKKIGTDEDLVFLEYYAGRAYVAQKKYDKAQERFEQSIVYAKKIEDREYISENYLAMADMFNETKQYDLAYKYLIMHNALEDSLLTEETTRQLSELKTVYETEKKEKEIELSHQKLQNYEAKQSRLMLIIFSSVGGAVLLLVIVLVVLSRYRLKQRANEKLESAYSIIEEKQKDITDSINYAQKIQYAILPNDDDIKSAFADAFVFFKPRDVVSGDFYWFHVQEYQHANNSTDTLVMLAAADCTGHGVPGALMSMIGSSLLNQIVLEGKVNSTGEVLDLLRQGIKAAFKQKQGENKRRDGMDIGLLAFSNGGRKVQFSGANNGVYHVRDGQLKELNPDKQPVGQHEGEEKPFTWQEMETKKGDCFYLYTDGFADQFGGDKGKKFKYAKLKELLLSIHSLPMEDQRLALDKHFTDWKGALEQVDDVLIIGVRV